MPGKNSLGPISGRPRILFPPDLFFPGENAFICILFEIVGVSTFCAPLGSFKSCNVTVWRMYRCLTTSELHLLCYFGRGALPLPPPPPGGSGEHGNGEDRRLTWQAGRERLRQIGRSERTPYSQPHGHGHMHLASSGIAVSTSKSGSMLRPLYVRVPATPPVEAT